MVFSSEMRIAALAVVMTGAGFAANRELPLDQMINGDFEAEFSEEGRKAFGWNRFGACYRVQRNAGENGSTGLVWRNDDPKKYEVAASPIRLEPGTTYEISCRYKTVRLETPVKATGWVGLCVECKDADGKYTKGIYQGGYKATDGAWKGIYQIGTVPENAVTMTVSPTVGPGFVGEVHFDSIVVKRAVHKPVFGLYVSAYRDKVANGKFDVVAGLDLKSAKLRTEDFEPLLSVPVASGGRKKISADRYDVKSARFTVDAETLPFGESALIFGLRNRKTGKVAEDCSVRRTIERVKELPRPKVSVDGRNRLIVDGRPFFPLGLYWNDAKPKEEELAEYGESPFNCVLNYQQLSSEVMDSYDRHGIKVIYSVEGIYGPGLRFKSEKEIFDWTRREVERHRGHPALLAWYTNDERGNSYVPQLERRYRLIGELDPNHPVYAVLYQLPIVRYYMDTCDIIGTDPYPVGNPYSAGNAEHIEICSEWADASVEGSYRMRPVWQVPQVFDWGVYHKDKADKSRMPSSAELKNMFWQAIACGANGLVGYSYFDVKRMSWKNPWKQTWADVCEAAGEVRRFFPVLLSDGIPPAVSCGSADVRVRAWRDDERAYVLAVNIRNRPVSASISAGGDWTVAESALGPSPVEVGKGVFKLELPALGAAMVRLDAAKDETAAIQSRIDAAAAAGGRVEIGAGDHHIRSLLLKSGVKLHLKAGARLIGSRSPDDYEMDLSPLGCGKNVTRRWSNAMIRIVNAHDVAITGEKGSAICGRNCFDAAGEEGFRGPHAISAFGVTNLVLCGYTVEDAGNFGIYAQGCANITAKNVTVLGGHDGFDFFGCTKVLVEDCRIFSGDDCVAGYNNRDVTVRNCELNSSCSYFRIGGNDVLVENCRGSAPAMHPHRWSLSGAEKRLEKTPDCAGRRNTLSVFTFFTGKSVKKPAEKIVFRNCRFDGVDRLMHYNLSGSERWQNGLGLAEVEFDRVCAKGLSIPLVVYGEKECPLRFRMKGCEITFREQCAELMKGAFVGELELDDVSVSGAERLFLNYKDMQPAVKITSLRGISAEIANTDAQFKSKSL